MKIDLEHAKVEDLDYLDEREDLGREKLEKKIEDGEIIVVKDSDGKNIGWLRFNYFWDEIPFMNMLVVEEEHQRKGIGSKLVSFWEREMKENGHDMVMTSSLSDEDAQHFFRKLGYEDSGLFSLEDEVPEIIFTKKL